MSRTLQVIDLGSMDYRECLALQRRLALARIAGEDPNDILLLVEHQPVITVGRNSDRNHLLASPDTLRKRGVELHEIDRGGDVTFHGPGQLVGYLIYDLKEHKQDLHWFLRTIEEALIGALGEFGIQAIRNEGLTGVWVENRKIASIGVHVKQWVTWHGFALNVSTDLSYFDLIVPCGIAGVEMTTVEKEIQPPDGSSLWDTTKDRVVNAMANIFHHVPHQTSAIDG